MLLVAIRANIELRLQWIVALCLGQKPVATLPQQADLTEAQLEAALDRHFRGRRGHVDSNRLCREHEPHEPGRDDYDRSANQ